jgi:sporulation protein YlmC with PRC-barrel domain
MASSVVRQDLVGLEAFSRDGTKLGKIKAVVGDGESSAAYLVIGRFLARDLVIPVDAVETPGDRVVVPHGSSFLDSAPAIKAKGAISPQDAARLEAFYRSSAT